MYQWVSMLPQLHVIDEDNTSYYTEGEWSVLPEEQSGEEHQNETQNETLSSVNVTTENETLNISNISIDNLTVFEPVSQIEIGKPVQWTQSFDVNNTFTVNISGSAYNITVDDVDSKNDVIVVKNVHKSLRSIIMRKKKNLLRRKSKTY